MIQCLILKALLFGDSISNKAIYSLLKCILLQIEIFCLMQDSSSNPRQNSYQQSDSEESQIAEIPQLVKANQSFTEQIYKSSGEYIKVSSKNFKIDEDAILEEFNRKNEEQQKDIRNPSKSINKKKIKKPSQAASKKYDIGSLRKRWKAEMDENINKYKQYLTDQKSSYDAKEKQYLLEFYKVLLDGVFELKYHSEDQHNDLTSNEKKVIATESDYHLYLKGLVDNYDKAFKQAKFTNKIPYTKAKWDPLIKNCKDETNFELRRKIIRMKIKPIHVLENSDKFLMSEQAKLLQQRRMKLILNEAAKNFDRPHEGTEQHQQIEMQQNFEINDLPEVFDPLRSISSFDHMEKRINQEKEKLQEFKQCVNDQPALLLKKRIDQLLKGTSSYDKIMEDFRSKFPSM